MEFMQTQTCRNLARSFAGESQARQRYTQYADQARKEGLAYLARIFEETAANEQIHAQEFLEKLQKYGRQPIENIDISAGYPYTLGVTMENLLEAAKGENEESVRVYPGFAKTAREEGYADIASLWENIARIEAVHRDVFLESYEQMQTERLYKKEHPIVWRCLNCGFVMLSKEAFRVCPVCGKDRGWAEGDIQTRGSAKRARRQCTAARQSRKGRHKKRSTSRCTRPESGRMRCSASAQAPRRRWRAGRGGSGCCRLSRLSRPGSRPE